MPRYFLLLIACLTLPQAQQSDARKLLEESRAAVDIRSTGPFLIVARVTAGQGEQKGEGKYRFVWVSPEKWREDAVIGSDLYVTIFDGKFKYTRSTSAKAETILRPYSAIGSYGVMAIDGSDGSLIVERRKVEGRELSCWGVALPQSLRSSIACLENGLPVLLGDSNLYSDFRDVFGKKFPFSWRASVYGIEYSANVEDLSRISQIPPELFAVDESYKRIGSNCPTKVSPSLAAGQNTRAPAPEYPSIAKQRRVQGTVVIEATIDENGAISNARVIGGHPMLRDPALKAVLGWKYRPTLCDGVPVPVETTIEVTFSLGG
jgi:TonB family protein